MEPTEHESCQFANKIYYDEIEISNTKQVELIVDKDMNIESDPLFGPIVAISLIVTFAVVFVMTLVTILKIPKSN